MDRNISMTREQWELVARFLEESHLDVRNKDYRELIRARCDLRDKIMDYSGERN